jgi:hypothetical protein
MTDATPAASRLRRRMVDDMSLRNLSPATQRSYIYAVKRFTVSGAWVPLCRSA